MASDVTVPNLIVNGPLLDAPTIMANWNALLVWINANVLQLDASKATTSILTGPNSDPISANQYTRKSYGDNLVSSSVAAEAVLKTAGDRRVGATLKKTNAQTINSGVATTIIFDVESDDTDGFCVAGGTTMTVPTGLGGNYVVFGRATIGSVINPSTALLVNGVVVTQSSPAAVTNQPCMWQGLLAVGDVVTLQAKQNNGGAAGLLAGDGAILTIYRIAA